MGGKVLRGSAWVAGFGLIACSGSPAHSTPHEGSTSTAGAMPPAAASSSSSTGSSSSSVGGSSRSSESGVTGNSPPQPADDTVVSVHDQDLLVGSEHGVLINDIDPDGDVLQILDTRPMATMQGGSVSLAGDGSYVYTPPANFGGCDAFDYSVSDADGASGSATVHITVEHPTERPSPLEVGSSAAAEIRTFRGEAGVGRAGRSVFSPGDLDGDGLGDLLVGAPMWAGRDQLSTGRVYTISGRTFATQTKGGLLADAQTLTGASTKSEAGYALGSAGDVDGDGVQDFIVGAWKTNLGGGPMGDVVGETFVVWGGQSDAALDLSQVRAGSGGFAITGAEMADFSGAAVDGGGDYNGDGTPDILVGAPLSSPHGMQSGRAYVIYGKTDGAQVLLADVDTGSGGVSFRGEAAADHVGSDVAHLGDVNGDAQDDFAVSADQAQDGRGTVYVLFGPVTDSTDLADLDPSQGFVLTGEAPEHHLGAQLSGGGDFNGDGTPDLAIGAYGVDNYRGRVYVVFGGEAPSDVSKLHGGAGLILECEQASDYCGAAVQFGGDLNDDGYDDLVIGAWRASRNREKGGRVYVVFGRPSATTIDLSEVASGHGGYAIDGAADGSLIGRSVAGGHDTDGDGVPDLLLGASGADAYTGAAHWVPGVFVGRCPVD